jgi:hypothetical protein
MSDTTRKTVIASDDDELEIRNPYCPSIYCVEFPIALGFQCSFLFSLSLSLSLSLCELSSPRID